MRWTIREEEKLKELYYKQKAVSDVTNNAIVINQFLLWHGKIYEKDDERTRHSVESKLFRLKTIWQKEDRSSSSTKRQRIEKTEVNATEDDNNEASITSSEQSDDSDNESITSSSEDDNDTDSISSDESVLQSNDDVSVQPPFTTTILWSPLMKRFQNHNNDLLFDLQEKTFNPGDESILDCLI